MTPKQTEGQDFMTMAGISNEAVHDYMLDWAGQHVFFGALYLQASLCLLLSNRSSLGERRTAVPTALRTIQSRITDRLIYLARKLV